jgi:hypothetical protein
MTRRRTAHGEKRAQQGRPVESAWNDAQKANTKMQTLTVELDDPTCEELDEEQMLEEALEDFAGDLIVEEKYRPYFLPRLLSHDKGAWQSVRVLCQGVVEAEQRLSELTEAITEVTGIASSDLTVTHLDSPESVNGEYAFILFYSPAFFWTSPIVTIRKW